MKNQYFCKKRILEKNSLSRLNMNNNIIFEKALDIAIKAHKGQIVALLHDVIEDTEITPEYLLSEGFPTKSSK